MRTLTLVVGAAVLLLAPSAWAVTFDFGQFGNGNGAGYTSSVTAGEGGYSSFTIARDGIMITISAYAISGGATAPPYAYLDAYLGTPGDPGGLGACQETNCEGNSDDNVTENEGLLLHFSEAVVLQDAFFRNQDHGTDFPDENGGPFLGIGSDVELFAGYDLEHHVNFDAGGMMGLHGQDFVFQYGNTDFYIEQINVVPENPVPEPATLGLLGMGLLSLAARARRRRS